MKKKIFTLLTLLLCAAAGVWAASPTAFDLTNYTVTSGKYTTTSGDVTLTLSKSGGNIGGAATNSRGFRWQADMSISIELASGYRIQTVKLTSSNNGNIKDTKTYTLTDGSSPASGTWNTAPLSAKADNYTWTATSGTSYTNWVLTNTSGGSTTSDIYISSITVTYEVYTPTNTAPSILTQPVTTLTAYVGAEATLSVAASGYPAPSYQWYSNTSASNEGGTPIDGATSGTYAFTPDATGTYYYYAVATNNYDDADHTATSNVATVTVKERGLISYATEDDEATSVPLAATYYEKSADITLPTVNRYFYKEGYSVTKWNDGTNDYALGASYTVTGDATIAPVFAANTKELADEATSITWTFATSNGAPLYTVEGENKTTTVISTTANGIDLKLDVLTTKNGSDVGKFNNSSDASRAQVNAYTQFTIPAVKGMTVKYTTTNGTLKTTDDVLFGEDHAASISGKDYVYTYNGSDATLTIYDNVGSRYPSGITVTYPEPKTNYAAPTIAVGDFSFEHHAYPVTITASEGDLYVSTDGTSYTAQTSPYQVNVTETTHFYAKATGAELADSEVAEENVTASFDAAKPYVAWVYEPTYTSYNVATDQLVTALEANYNVVKMGYASTDTPDVEDLKQADLVAITEAVTGAGAMVKALKGLVGQVPVLGMKFFAYNSGRWDWATPKNEDKSTKSITPASKYYKVFDGVTFDGDDIVLFGGSEDKNHVQYVDTWSAEPAGDVTLATSSSKPAIHASTTQQYFGFGLSCDDFGNYTDNAVTIVKNAAAMLIAGEALDAEQVPAEVGAYEWATFSSDKALDFSSVTGLTAYIVTGHSGTSLVTEQVTGTVPAGTGLLLNGAEGTYTIPVVASSTTVSENKLKAGDGSAVSYDATKTKYVLSVKEEKAVFKKIVEGTDATVAAGKAYLEFDEVISAPLFSLGFDSETTGISTVAAEHARTTGEAVYNLAGQRVSQPTRGLYIVGGKKVVKK